MSRRHLGAIDRDRKCLRGRSDSVMLARNCETKSSRTHEEDDDQNEADKSTTPREGGRVKQRRHAVKAAHLAPLKELLDQLWDDERTDRQQHHHRRADDGEADEVTREVRHAVEGDRGVARLHDHPAAGSAHDRVSGSEGKLHGPNRGLVASDAGLRDRAGRHLGRRGGLGANRGAGDAHRLAVLGAASFLAALLAHGKSSLSETESPHPAIRCGPRAAGAGGRLPTSGEALRLNSKQAGGRGSRFRSVGCDLGWFTACLLLGRGTQPTETWATTCCVPDTLIPLNMGTVKHLQLRSRDSQTSVVSSAYSSSLIRSSSSLGSSIWTRSSHADPYGSLLTISGFSSASELTSTTSPVIGASIGDDASSDSTWPMRRLACSTSPRSGSSRAVISPIWSWR